MLLRELHGRLAPVGPTARLCRAVLLPVMALVAGIAVLSSLWPVLRALRVDPAVALRYE